MNKVVCLVVLFAMLSIAFAQLPVSGGFKDHVGNYYDYTTGQVSSAVTGKVYQGVPGVPAVPLPYAHYPYAGVYHW